MVAERDPVVMGVNVTDIVQDPAAANTVPQVEVLAKSPAFVPPSLIEEMFSAAPPEFVTVIMLGLLVVPSTTPEKVTLPGEIMTTGVELPPPQPPVMITRTKRNRHPTRTSQPDLFDTGRTPQELK